MGDPLDEIFFQTEKEKEYWNNWQDEKRKHHSTETNRFRLNEENYKLREELKKQHRIEKIEGQVAFLERMILKLARLTNINQDELYER